MTRWFFGGLALSLAACRAPSRDAAPAPPLSASSRVPAEVASTAPSASRPADRSGTWTGTYQSAPHRIDLPAVHGGLPEWASDDGKRAVGTGRVRLTVTAVGTVSGTASGPLGEQVARGDQDETHLTLELSPAPGATGAYFATAALAVEKDRATGTFSASNVGASVARSGPVVLSRTGE